MKKSLIINYKAFNYSHFACVDLTSPHLSILLTSKIFDRKTGKSIMNGNILVDDELAERKVQKNEIEISDDKPHLDFLL